MIYGGCVVRVSKHIIAKPSVNNYNVVHIMDVNRRIGVLPREIWRLEKRRRYARVPKRNCNLQKSGAYAKASSDSVQKS